MYYFIISIFSISGVPPLAGFFAKLLVIYQLVNNGQVSLSIIVILVSGLSSFYYIRLIKNLVFKKKGYTPKPFLLTRPCLTQVYIISLAVVINVSFILLP
jgi:NADH:ubiquinone oxidoreductase subunit 2 (subunit N)